MLHTDSMHVKTRKAEQTEATRAALIAAGRRLFSERGFTQTSTEEIVRAARVTRGALYHHFEDKAALFAAVLETVSKDVMKRIREAATTAGPPGSWDHLVAGCTAFLDAALDEDVQRIALIEGPAVLGWQRWREIDERCAFGVMRMGVEKAMDAGVIEQQAAVPLARMLMGALNEAAIALVRSEDPEAARDEIGASVVRLLEGLRPRS